jgi:adenylate cyclase
MKPFDKKLSLATGLAVAGLASIGMLAGVFETWSQSASDRFFLPRETDTDIVIVAIDDASLGSIGRWPWDRTVHADLIDTLSAAGAKTIALDVNFPEPSDERNDEALADALARARNVVLPIELAFQRIDGELAYDASRVVEPIATIKAGAEGTGFSNTPLDGDGLVRRVPLSAVSSEGEAVYAFAYETAKLASAAPPLSEIPLDGSGRLIIHFADRPGEAFPVIPAADILAKNFDPQSVNNKIVFIGATARDLHDEQSVPTSNGNPMSGVEIHASIYNTLSQRDFLQEVPVWVYVMLFALIGLVLGFLVPRVRARTSFFITVAIYIAWLLAAFALFDRGWILDIVWIGLLLIFGYAGLLLERWVTTESERRKTRDAFSRYVSASVVESIMMDVDKLKLGGQRRTMSVLFSDLRGFTTLSEGMQPEQLVEVLNTYLDEMTDIVFDEVGVLDKYIGDAVMAFWNAPFDQTDHAERAVRTAVKMKERLAEMNKDGSFPKGIELRVGVGVNTGDMVVGNIGGERRYDYTVIGDSVNLASRTESLCKEYGVQIIITENTRQALSEEFLMRPIDKVAVKGKKEPIMIYEVMGFASEESDARHKLAAQFREALNAYFARDFKKAKKLCEQILSDWPEDGPSKSLIARSETYLACPPLMDWDGAWVMTKK